VENNNHSLNVSKFIPYEKKKNISEIRHSDFKYSRSINSYDKRKVEGSSRSDNFKEKKILYF